MVPTVTCWRIFQLFTMGCIGFIAGCWFASHYA